MKELDVSRETLERLEVYAELLKRWNPRINLVSKASLTQLWQRHMHDSIQIHELALHPVYHWVDLGSGGGFPGLVNAILAMERKSPFHVTLVESDMRKSAFLKTVIRETAAPAKVITARIEEIEPMGADVISARALADLRTLLSFAYRHLNTDGLALFLKGASWQKELADAKSEWRFDYQVDKSKTARGPVIMKIKGVDRV